MTTPDSVLFSDELVAEIQGAAPEVVLEAFSLVTLLGNTEFFILFLTLFYWGVNREKGLPLLAVALTAAVVSAGLKEAFGIPRPPTELHLIEASHYGIPSGHAMSPLLIYGAVLYTVESLSRIQKFVVGVAVVFPISVSRIFLGVHYPADTLGGWLFGGILLALFVLYAEMEIERTLLVAVSVSAPFLIFVGDIENILFGFGGLGAVVVGWWIGTEADSLDVSTAEGAAALVAGVVVVGVGWTLSSNLSGLYVLVTAFVISLFVVGYLDVIARFKEAFGVSQ